MRFVLSAILGVLVGAWLGRSARDLSDTVHDTGARQAPASSVTEPEPIASPELGKGPERSISTTTSGFESYRDQYRLKRRRSELAHATEMASEEGPFPGLSFADPRYPAAHRPAAFESSMATFADVIEQGVAGHQASIAKVDCSAVPCLLAIDVELDAQAVAEFRADSRPLTDALREPFDRAFEPYASHDRLGVMRMDHDTYDMLANGVFRTWHWWQPFSPHQHPYLAQQVRESAMARIEAE